MIGAEEPLLPAVRGTWEGEEELEGGSERPLDEEGTAFHDEELEGCEMGPSWGEVLDPVAGDPARAPVVPARVVFVEGVVERWEEGWRWGTEFGDVARTETEGEWAAAEEVPEWASPAVVPLELRLEMDGVAPVREFERLEGVAAGATKAAPALPIMTATNTNERTMRQLETRGRGDSALGRGVSLEGPIARGAAGDAMRVRRGPPISSVWSLRIRALRATWGMEALRSPPKFQGRRSARHYTPGRA